MARVKFDHDGLEEGTAVVLGLPRKDVEEDVTEGRGRMLDV